MIRTATVIFLLIVVSSARAATVFSFSAEINSLQAGIGLPFSLGQKVAAEFTIGTLGPDLAGSNTLSAFAGAASMSVAVADAGFSATGVPGRSVTHPGSLSWLVDGLLTVKNTPGDDTLELLIGRIDSDPRDYGGVVSGTPDPVGGRSLDGISLHLRDADGIAFDSLGQNPDPIEALQLFFANSAEFSNSALDRAEIRFHFTPDNGPNQPTKIIAAELTPVPLPAGIWLLASVLIPALYAGKRRSIKTPSTHATGIAHR